MTMDEQNRLFDFVYCVGYKIQTVYKASPAVAMVIGVVNLLFPTVGVVVTVGGTMGEGVMVVGVMVEGVT